MENLDLENDKREEFRQILYELARAAFDEAKEDYLPIIERLESLYWNDENGDNTGFRHFYSDIFSVLVDIQNEEVTNKAGSIAVLGNNLGLIRQHYQKNKNHDKNQRPIDISNNLKKLFDHVSLDIARMEYSDAGDEKISNSGVVKGMNRQIELLKDDIAKEQGKLVYTQGKLDSMQKEYIAILGIFSAIVIAFVGEMTFSTSVLENAHKLGDIFTIIAVVAIVGLSFANILFSLFYFVGKIVRDDGIINNGIWKTMNLVAGYIVLGAIILHCCSEYHVIGRMIELVKNLI